MNHYMSLIAKLALLFHPNDWGYAITLGQQSYFSCAEDQVDAAWHAHEDKHKEQWAREGYLMFSIKYLLYSLIYGYENNPYETEARKAAEEINNGDT